MHAKFCVVRIDRNQKINLEWAAKTALKTVASAKQHSYSYNYVTGYVKRGLIHACITFWLQGYITQLLFDLHL